MTLRFLRLWIAACCVAAGAAAPALVIHPEPGTTLDPALAPPPRMDPGWSHVGRFGAGTGVFLGTNDLGEPWLLTAAHVGSPGTFRLDGTDYTTDVFVDFTNPLGRSADLRAWRLSADPGLPNLPIADATPAPGSRVVTLGTGRSTGAASCWDADWNATGCARAVHEGYRWGPRRKQWGTNTTTRVGHAGPYDAVFGTTFDRFDTALESQAAGHDSGGGAFVLDPVAGTWRLAGIAVGIEGPGDPARPPQGLAVLDEDVTVYADLAFYRYQIAAATGIVPAEEPGILGRVALGAVALGVVALGIAVRGSRRRARGR